MKTLAACADCGSEGRAMIKADLLALLRDPEVQAALRVAVASRPSPCAWDDPAVLAAEHAIRRARLRGALGQDLTHRQEIF